MPVHLLLERREVAAQRVHLRGGQRGPDTLHCCHRYCRILSWHDFNYRHTFRLRRTPCRWGGGGRTVDALLTKERTWSPCASNIRSPASTPGSARSTKIPSTAAVPECSATASSARRRSGVRCDRTRIQHAGRGPRAAREDAAHLGVRRCPDFGRTRSVDRRYRREPRPGLTEDVGDGAGRIEASGTPSIQEPSPVSTPTSAVPRRRLRRRTRSPRRDREQPYAALGLKADEYARIREILGRRPTSGELAMYSVMWSEHCSYKSSQDLPAPVRDQDHREDAEEPDGRHRRERRRASTSATAGR